MDDIKRIDEIRRRISEMPRGTLVYKNIKNKQQPYIQWTENGHSHSRYVKVEERDYIIRIMDEKKVLSQELKQLEAKLAIHGHESDIPDIAYLSADGGFTLFEYDNRRIRFRAPHSLEAYYAIKLWDAGYMEVLAKYIHSAEPIEEYIDLVPILEDLYIDSKSFCDKIKRVEIKHG